jgi:hypothetical protein
MTFLCRNVPGFCQQLFAPFFFVSTNSPIFMKSYFRIPNWLLLHPSRCTPSIEPQSAKFLHTVCQRFCQFSEPCLDPCFSSLQRTMARGWRGDGRVKCETVETMFNQELTPIGPHPNLIIFNPLHCYKKSIHAAGDHHWSRQNIRLVRTITLY